MRRIALALAFASLPLAAAPAFAQVQLEASGPLVRLSVTENVVADPDIANLSAGVTTLAPTAVEAMRQNAEQMTRVIDRIEALGVDEDDIQTSGISLNPDYEYNRETQEQEFRGYRVMNRVSVKVRDIDETGTILDALAAIGATDIGGISWSIDDPTDAQDMARQTAFRTGRERALEYARLAGYSDIRLLEISENIASSRPAPMPTNRVMEAAADEVTPVRPGQVQTGVTVNFVYEFIQ